MMKNLFIIWILFCFGAIECSDFYLVKMTDTGVRHECFSVNPEEKAVEDVLKLIDDCQYALCFPRQYEENQNRRSLYLWSHTYSFDLLKHDPLGTKTADLLLAEAKIRTFLDLIVSKNEALTRLLNEEDRSLITEIIRDGYSLSAYEFLDNEKQDAKYGIYVFQKNRELPLTLSNDKVVWLKPIKVISVIGICAVLVYFLIKKLKKN